MKHIDKILPLIFLVIFLCLYLFRVTETVDFPNWDETYYMRRGLVLMLGDLKGSGIANVNTSPLMPMGYAILYSVIRGPGLYPYAIIASVTLLTLGCFTLLSRFLNRYLALGLTMIVIVSALPVKIGSINYYAGAGMLWLGLAVFGKRPISRGIGLLIVALSIYLRPEYIFVFVMLSFAMLVYEVKQLRRTPDAALITIVAYLPVIIFMGWTVLMLTLAPPNSDGRTVNAIPWSYNNYLLGSGRETDTTIMGGDTFLWYERDFGHMSSMTITNELVALLQNPQQSAEFIGFDTLWMFEIYAKSFLTGWTWNNTYSWVTRPAWGAALVFWIVISGLLYNAFRIRRIVPPTLPTIALLSLVVLIPWLILVNPDQRTFMTFPLLMVPVGYALTIWAEKLNISNHVVRRVGMSLLVVMLLLTPRPFDTIPQTRIKTQYATIKQTGTSCYIPGMGDTFVNIAVLDEYACPEAERPPNAK